jgi:hypothetical protein
MSKLIVLIKNNLLFLFHKLKVKKQYFFSFVLAALSFVAAKSIEEAGVERYYSQKATNFHKEDGYFDLESPSTVNSFPMGIDAFSDVTMLDSTHIVGINTMNGNVVLIDLNSNSISNQLSLSSEFQFVDIARMDSTLILLDSGNKLHFLLPPYDSTSLISMNETKENFPTSGICFHESTKRLFLLSEVKELEEGQISCFLYAFNLNKRQFKEDPLFEINTSAIETFALNNNLPLPKKTLSFDGDSLEGLSFNPSAIAVHPKTNEIYVLSTDDRSLVVFNQFGEVMNFTTLNAVLFSKPTGMTFQDNGDLLITNSDLMRPTIIRLKWNKLYQSLSGHGIIFGR